MLLIFRYVETRYTCHYDLDNLETCPQTITVSLPRNIAQQPVLRETHVITVPIHRNITYNLEKHSQFTIINFSYNHYFISLGYFFN